ncbi:MAG TPA: hypothetical protein VMA34_01550 [Terracidiphilus sp.]|nr:hypothetical protein [Terracidiphilus sp.]
MSGFAPAMWAVWALFMLLFAAVKLYASNLEKNEDDQLFLDDSFNHVKSEQDAIVARVHQVEPYLRLTLVLACVMSLFVVGYYVLDMVRQFR